MEMEMVSDAGLNAYESQNIKIKMKRKIMKELPSMNPGQRLWIEPMFNTSLIWWWCTGHMYTLQHRKQKHHQYTVAYIF